MLDPDSFFDLADFEHRALFDGCDHVWDALHALPAYLAGIVPAERELLGEVSDRATLYGDAIHVAEGAVVEDGATIHAPAWIGPGTEVRQGAYLRGNVLAGSNCVLGHVSEFKNAVLLNGAQAPHFAYVGDSILGARVNLGAGTKLSNLAVNSVKGADGKRPTISFSVDDVSYDTGLAKLGAIIGDDAQTGCNSVLNPGCLLGRETLVYANVSLGKGLVPARSIVKLRQETLTVPKR